MDREGGRCDAGRDVTVPDVGHTGNEPTVPQVCAVIVTYNRKALLEECLTALAGQSRRPDRILVVDNASSDGTADMVRADHPHVELLPLAENIGGAGGFHEGLRAAHERGVEWVWLMDDDTIPGPEALQELLKASDAVVGLAAPLLMASKVVWTDGRLHPMNEAKFKTDREGFVDSCALGLLPLRQATFVSLLVHRLAIDSFGLPLKHYFIWSDDLEYTGRILKNHASGWYVPDSVVLHKTKEPHTAVTEAGGRFYFHVRNMLYMARGSAWTPLEKLVVLWTLWATIPAYLRQNRFRRESFVVVLRGLRDGVKPMPPASRP